MYYKKAGIVIFWVFLVLTFQQSVLWAQGRVWRVPQERPTIQEAIDECRFNSEDVVRVSDGIHGGDINFNGKDITVYSVNGASSTIIQGTGNGSVVTFNSGEGHDSVLRGFTVTGGNATYGGGIYCDGSSPTLTANIVRKNKATYGGGICCYAGSHAIIGDNVIGGEAGGNSATYFGGGVCCYSNSNPEIRYNTITNNDAEYGGGICCFNSSPNIIGNGNSVYGGQISSNVAEYGGGISCIEESAPNIKTSNDISNNTAYSSGGGIYCKKNTLCHPQIWNNSISGNKAGMGGMIDGAGGGIFCLNSSPSIRYNKIESNELFGDESACGGGIFCDYSSALIAKNEIRKNKARPPYAVGSGGGIYCASDVTITTNLIEKNEAYLEGGGIYCDGDSLVINNLIHENKIYGDSAGAGIYINQDRCPELTNNTIVYNSAIGPASTGGGVYCDGGTAPVITNCIIWGNFASTGTVQDEIDQFVSANPLVTYCCIKFGYPGVTNISTNPLFLNEVPMLYHLTFPSPCKDTGDNNAPGLSLPIAQKDFENDDRNINGIVDRGWDEYKP